MRQEQGRFGGPEVGKFTDFSKQYFSTPTPPDLPEKDPEEVIRRARKIIKDTDPLVSALEKATGIKEKDLEKSLRRRLPEPNPEPEKPLFVNGYSGNFAQDMAFDEVKIGKALRIAHLDGVVSVVQMPQSRQRSIEANPDGSVSAKRNLIFGEDLEEKENRENPLKRVVSIPEGWRIEINDARITEELMQKKLTGEQLKKQFVKRFNSVLKGTIMECVLKEKLTGAKDGNFMFNSKVFVTLFTPSLLFVMRNIGNFGKFNVGDVVEPLAYTPLSYLTINALNKIQRDSLRENIDHLWEYFMPPIEIDKVAETFIYLLTKGRKLVEKKRPQTF